MIEVASSLSLRQLCLLTNGPKYVSACQNCFSHQFIDEIIVRKYQNSVECIKSGLNDNCMSISDQRAKEFFTRSHSHSDLGQISLHFFRVLLILSIFA